MKIKNTTILAFILVFLTSIASFADKNKEEIPDINDLDPVLKAKVHFWIDVYTKYTTEEGLIHDAKYPEIIYEKISLKPNIADFKLAPRQQKRKSQARVDEIKNFYKKLLLSIHKKQQKLESLTEAEKRVYELFKNINETNKFFSAAHNKRIRLQLGQKDRFLQGLSTRADIYPLWKKSLKTEKFLMISPGFRLLSLRLT